MIAKLLSGKRRTYIAILAVSVGTLVILGSTYSMINMKNTAVRLVEDSYPASSKENTTVARLLKRPLLVFVGIYSAPVRSDRRTALRETWLQKCHTSEKAVCRFVTDGQDTKGNGLQEGVRTKLENENLLHGDLLLAETPGGLNFPRRYLWMAKWASERYNFQYFLRLDDDYFICFDKLLLELEFHRPKVRFQWGWLHCQAKEFVALDEGFLVVTKDLIESFLSRKDTTLLCHIWDAQAVALWTKEIPNLTTFGDNARIFHREFDSKEKAANRTEICHSSLAIHKSYPEEMRLYWSIYQRENKTIPYKVPPVIFPCGLPLRYEYTIFRGSKWFAEPTLCKDKPIWNRGGYFKGRQEEAR